MPVQLGAKPQAGFDEPVALLMDCHRRVEKFLQVLIHLSDHVAGGALDSEHRHALETALNYFRAAAPRHTQDEEVSLFPRLRHSSDARMRAALVKVDALEADHRTVTPYHERVDELGCQWLQHGRLESAVATEFSSLLKRLTQMYQQHIRVEDEEIYPLAIQALSANDRAAIGQEMKQRRSSDPGRAGSRCARSRQQILKEFQD